MSIPKMKPGPYFGEKLAFCSRTQRTHRASTCVNPVNVKVTVAATYIGQRTGRFAGTELDDYWTADAFLTWEPFDKRFELDLAAYNMLRRRFRRGAGRTRLGPPFIGSLKVRF